MLRADRDPLTSTFHHCHIEIALKFHLQVASLSPLLSVAELRPQAVAACAAVRPSACARFAEVSTENLNLPPYTSHNTRFEVQG
jgi:hypothetical protein